MKILTAIQGRLTEIMEAETELAERAMTRGTSIATVRTRDLLRQQVRTAMGSERVAKAWRSNVYPKAGHSMSPAGFVWTNAEKIVLAFSRSSVVRSRSGAMLAIPTPDVPRRSGAFAKRITPDNWPENEFGPLRLVKRKGKTAMLVVDAVRRSKTGRVRALTNQGLTKTGRYRKGFSSVVMFFLVPMVRLPMKWDPQAVFDAAPGLMVDEIMAAWGAN